MELTFASATGSTRKYKIAVAVLAVLSVIGVLVFCLSYTLECCPWGVNNSVAWGQLITVMIYFIGLSAGSLVVSSLTYVFGREEYKPIGRMAVFMGLLLMAGAMFCVMVDLGRPEGFWRLFGFFYSNNMKSLFAINGLFYGGYLLLLILYLGAALANSKWTKVLAPAAVLWAILVHTGTGSIFGFVAARGVFYSSMKPIEFVSAAVASGLALVMVMSYFTLKFSRREVPTNMFVSLGSLLKLLIVVLVLLVAVDKLTHYYPPHRESLLFLTTGAWAWIFWGMQFTLGYVVPLFILFHPRWGKTLKGVLIAAAINVIGIFGERAALIFPGLGEPLHLYPGTVEGIWGDRGTYPVTAAETLITVGIVALISLIYLIGIRYLRVLPGESAVEEVQELAEEPEPAAAAE